MNTFAECAPAPPPSAAIPPGGTACPDGRWPAAPCTDALCTDALCADAAFAQWAALLQWGDSTLPVGAFAFSCGLETAVELGRVHDPHSLREFAAIALEQSARGDAVALAHAQRAARRGEWPACLRADAAVFARKLPEELRTQSTRVGRKLTELALDVLEDAPQRLAPWAESIREEQTPGTLPVAQGVIGAHLGLPLPLTLSLHQYGVLMTILNAALRLVRVSHVQVQRIARELLRELPRQCRHAARARLTDMGGFAPLSDIFSCLHARGNMRLFMS